MVISAIEAERFDGRLTAYLLYNGSVTYSGMQA